MKSKAYGKYKNTKGLTKNKQFDKATAVRLVLAVSLFLGIVLVLFFSDVGHSIGSCVAVVPINGEISMEGQPSSLFSPGTPNAADIAAAIKRASKKPNVKAIVLEINSPGGSVVGSRLIRHAIDESDKPVVAYLSEMAASGGYYIASGADYIVSDPNTITGSIGVLTMFTDARELLKKIGVNVTAITTGEHKTMGAFFKGLSPSDRQIVESLINETYQEFVQVVEEGRGDRLNRKAFLAIADGRILSGRQAYKIGMVDKLGYEEDALKEAAKLGNITVQDDENIPTCQIRVVAGASSPFGDVKTPFDGLVKELGGGIKFI